MNIPRLDRLLYGGSFDPVHQGHLGMIRYALERDLARVVDIVPAAVSPFKTHVPPIASRFRLEMLALAVEELPAQMRSRVEVRDIDLKRAPPSYTIDTLDLMEERDPGSTIGIFLGSDSLPDFPLWLRPDDILRRHPLLIFRRPGDDQESVEEDARDVREDFAHVSPKIFVLDNPVIECASTDLRKFLRRREYDGPILNCIPQRVLKYIQEHSLYSDGERYIPE